MKQKLIVNDSITAFSGEVNAHLDQGWVYVPHTLKMTMNSSGYIAHYAIVLAIEAAADGTVPRHESAIGSCPSEPHNGHTPPPFFSAPA